MAHFDYFLSLDHGKRGSIGLVSGYSLPDAVATAQHLIDLQAAKTIGLFKGQALIGVCTCNEAGDILWDRPVAVAFQALVA